jgi:hypothetical protein
MAAAVWLAPGTAGKAWAQEADEAKSSDSGTQIAQYYGIEVPQRRNMVRRGKTVLERWRPDYIALGVRAGSFIIRPGIDVQETYSDNIFRTPAMEEADFITRFMPRVSASSDWNNHSLSVFGRGDIGRYKDNSFEDYEDYTFGARGRLDVLRSTNVKARLETKKRHEDRSSPDDAGGRHPTEYYAHIGQLEGYHRLNRLNFTLGAGVERFDFKDSSTGLATINNDDRDRDEYEVSLRVGYEVISNYEAFVRATYNIRDYDAGMDDSGIDRDSDGYEAVAGIKVDFGGITFGNFFVGYRRQSYESPLFNASGGPVVGADITWNVTPLTTILGSIKREIRESTTGDGFGSFASGSFYTNGEISAQHELLRNLILEAQLGLSNNDFKGISRSDDLFYGGVSANYLLTRNFALRGGYRYRSRDSDVAGSDYNENVVFVRLQASY